MDEDIKRKSSSVADALNDALTGVLQKSLGESSELAKSIKDEILSDFGDRVRVLESRLEKSEKKIKAILSKITDIGQLAENMEKELQAE